MTALLVWQVAMVANASYCGWTAFNLFHAKRFLAAAIGAIASVAALVGAATSLLLYTIA